MKITSDIAILIVSRGREAYLTRLLTDIEEAYAPALAAGWLSTTTLVYAQNYDAAYIETLRATFAGAIADERLLIVEQARAHNCIGDVYDAAITALHAAVDYRLAMLMDDDSLYRAVADIDTNLAQAARTFLDSGARAFSIKLGQNRSLQYIPFVDPDGPIMPFKEKMLWVSRAVLEEALVLQRFSELAIGEDVVLSALAWRGDARRCFGVFGIATFIHLAFEPDEAHAGGAIGGGYGELVGYVEGAAGNTELGKYEKAIRTGVTPHTILPEIFVGPEHPQHINNGIRDEAVARYQPAASKAR